ncbi:hypothetical protein B9W64_35555 [Streptomyces sp. CS159]|nr:hypothetical protein B9W64_35555 [Streptomyces sp. CS159]
MSGAACAPPDLGPLPPRFSGPALSADTAVSEIRSALAAEGVEVDREPSNSLGSCSERLSGQHAPQTVESALKKAFARARAEYGWQRGPDAGTGALALTKGNWTVLAGLPVQPPQHGQAFVLVSMTCLEDGGASPSPGDSGGSATPGRPSDDSGRAAGAER